MIFRFLSQLQLRPRLRMNCVDAACAADVYPSTQWHTNALVDTTKSVLGLSRSAAWQFLHQKVQFPSSAAKKPYLSKPVFRYLRQTVSYFYSCIQQTAVRVFVDRLHEYSGQSIGSLPTPVNSKRPQLVLSKVEAVSLLAGDNFLVDVRAWEAVVDALAAVLKRLGGGDKVVETNALGVGKPLVVCLLGHVALVAVKIQEHLKRVGQMPAEQQKGMNQGHRAKWIAMLETVNGMVQATTQPQRGLRLLDGDSAGRAQVPEEEGDADALGGSSGDEDGGGDDQPEADEAGADEAGDQAA